MCGMAYRTVNAHDEHCRRIGRNRLPDPAGNEYQGLQSAGVYGRRQQDLSHSPRDQHPGLFQSGSEN